MLNKMKARSLARKWWKENKDFGPTKCCDRCDAAIPRPKGYLCKPSILGFSIGGRKVDLSFSPDVICGECFDKSKARPFYEWWQFWK